MPTREHAALALWLQVHDSAFPTGRMVHSHGLEEWLATRPDATGDEIAAAVLDYLRYGYAPLDATLTAAAWRAAPDPGRLTALDTELGSYKLYDNARTASISSGRRLAATVRELGLAGDSAYLDAVLAGHTPGHCAVVEGAVQAGLGIGLHTAVLGSLRAMLASLLSAAVRLGRLGALAGQRAQVRAVDLVVDLAEQACDRPIDEVFSTAPALDISGMRHETRTTRLFRT